MRKKTPSKFKNKKLLAGIVIGLVAGLGATVYGAAQNDAWNIGDAWMWFSTSSKDGKVHANTSTPVDNTNVATKAYVDAAGDSEISVSNYFGYSKCYPDLNQECSSGYEEIIRIKSLAGLTYTSSIFNDNQQGVIFLGDAVNVSCSVGSNIGCSVGDVSRVTTNYSGAYSVVCCKRIEGGTDPDNIDKDNDDIPDWDSFAYDLRYPERSGDLRGIDLSPYRYDESADQSGTILFFINNHTGNLGGRSGADNICASEKRSALQCNNIHALLSTSYDDSIKKMPINYGYNPYRNIFVYDNSNKGLYKIANDWFDFTKGSYYTSFPGFSIFWSGSNAQGDNSSNNCLGFSSSVVSGNAGNSTSFAVTSAGCSNPYPLLCACNP